jgi:hypothetical protein
MIQLVLFFTLCIVLQVELGKRSDNVDTAVSNMKAGEPTRTYVVDEKTNRLIEEK